MPLQDREWYRTYHTLARRRWRLPQAQPKNQSIPDTDWSLQDRESHRTYRHWTRRKWRFQRSVWRALAGTLRATVKPVAAAILLAYIAVSFVHLTNGFGLGTTLGAGFQDARLGLTCPTNLDRQWRFIDRTQIEHLALVSSINQGKHVYQEICSANQFPPRGWVIPAPAPASDSKPPPANTQIGRPTTEVLKFTSTPEPAPKTQVLNIDWLDDTRILEDAVQRAVNADRDSLGLPILIPNIEIADKARQHSRNMASVYATRGYLIDSGGSEFIGTDFGCGEILLARPRFTTQTSVYGIVVGGHGDIHYMSLDELTDVLVGQWLDSPDYAGNMRGAQYTHSGVGIFYDMEQEYVFVTLNLCFRR